MGSVWTIHDIIPTEPIHHWISKPAQPSRVPSTDWCVRPARQIWVKWDHHSRDEGRKYFESSPLCARRPPSVLLVAEGKIEIEACQPLPINRIQSLEGISCRTALRVLQYLKLISWLSSRQKHISFFGPKICNLCSTSAISRWSSRESC